MSTYGFTAKAALFDRLAELTVTGQPLDGVQVAYAFPGSNVKLECVYGGGIRFTHDDAVAEVPGVMVSEEATVSVFIRVVSRPPTDVRVTDLRAAAIGAQLATLLRSAPKLAGGNAVLGIGRGAADYSQTADETITILSYQVQVLSNLSYGSA